MTFKDLITKTFDAPVAQEGQVDAHQLQMGIEIEKEHSSNLAVRKKIALAHLRENPLYYTELVKMEKGDIK
jgi:hypothetical protein